MSKWSIDRYRTGFIDDIRSFREQLRKVSNVYHRLENRIVDRPYVCMEVYFTDWSSNRVLVRLGLDTLIGWQQLDSKYIFPMYVCMYV